MLEQHWFDACVEELCQPFHAQPSGRPSLPRDGCFRWPLLGLNSEQRIALLAADPLSMPTLPGVRPARELPG